jgi:hypothetical protein
MCCCTGCDSRRLLAGLLLLGLYMGLVWLGVMTSSRIHSLRSKVLWLLL